MTNFTRGKMARINRKHRYLIKRNCDGAFVGSTDDLGLRLPDGHIHVDTIGEDGLGPGIPAFVSRTPFTRGLLTVFFTSMVILIALGGALFVMHWIGALK